MQLLRKLLAHLLGLSPLKPQILLLLRLNQALLQWLRLQLRQTRSLNQLVSSLRLDWRDGWEAGSMG